MKQVSVTNYRTFPPSQVRDSDTFLSRGAETVMLLQQTDHRPVTSAGQE